MHSTHRVETVQAADLDRAPQLRGFPVSSARLTLNGSGSSAPLGPLSVGAAPALLLPAMVRFWGRFWGLASASILAQKINLSVPANRPTPAPAPAPLRPLTQPSLHPTLLCRSHATTRNGFDPTSSTLLSGGFPETASVLSLRGHGSITLDCCSPNRIRRATNHQSRLRWLPCGLWQIRA